MSAALVAAIEADPENVDNYRIYGDWLEIQGDPRGALIGMEVERERVAPVKQRFLDNQIADYRAAHVNGLLGPLAEYAALWAWRYGFIYRAAIRVPIPSPSGLLNALLAHPSARFLVELSIQGSKDAQALIDVLAAHAPATLHALDLNLWNGGGDLSTLWVRIPRLRKLTIAGDHELGTIRLPELRFASLATPSIGPCPELERLELRSLFRTDPSEVRALLARTDLPKLSALSLVGCRSADELVLELADTPVGRQLVELDLSYADLTDAGVAAWAAKPPARKLAVLRVRNTRVVPRNRGGLVGVAERVIWRQKDER